MGFASTCDFHLRFGRAGKMKYLMADKVVMQEHAAEAY